MATREEINRRARELYHARKNEPEVREAALARTRAWKERNRDACILKSSLWLAKERAVQQGVPFSLRYEDIQVPEFCPVLGIRLERARGASTDSSPSIDRLVPSLGYVPGNVMVISQKANRIKSVGTVEDLLAIVRYMQQNSK